MRERKNKILGYNVDAVDVSLLYIIINSCIKFTIITGFSFFKVTFLDTITFIYKALS
jgi:hypothetical protein